MICCLDLEGVLIPEIWIHVAKKTRIKALEITTRDEPDYDKLMRYRLAILKREGIKLRDIQAVIRRMDPLPGAQAFLKGVNAAASGLVVAAALLMLDVVRTPPQRTIALVCFTIHHWPGKDYFGPKYNAPATVAIGAVLGLPLCLPYVLAHPNP